MATEGDYTLGDLGAVLVKARLSTSEILSPFNAEWRLLHRRAVEEMRKRDVEKDRQRVLAAPDFLRSNLWGAVFSANCYFQYFKFFCDISGNGQSLDVKTAAIDAAHLHADVVPVELANLQHSVLSAEVLAISSANRNELLSCFTELFPCLKEARDAVAHASDRQFARFHGTSMDAEIGSRSLSIYGKYSLSSQGEDFLFDFSISRFGQLTSKLIERLV